MNSVDVDKKKNFFGRFLSFLVASLCIFIIGCADINRNTNWPDALHQVGHDLARGQCDRYINHRDYFECLKHADNAYQENNQSESDSINFK